MDVSRSMCSTDIPPNRLRAAQAAALSFIQRQKASTQIGIVVFAGFAELIQTPTTDQEILQDAVESLTTARRTAIGSAILKSLDAIAEINQNVAPSETGTSPGVELTPVPKGVYAPDIIVLLTDGASNAGPWPLNAAQQAADRGVRVYTIGFGTANGSISDCSQGLQGSDPFGGGGGFGGGGFRRGIDEDTLKEIAAMTGGTYYSAESAGELQNVFQELPTYLITRQEIMEISVAFTAIGALLAATAIVLSLIWHPLP
jgi:Ca-activated chloride channel homolog